MKPLELLTRLTTFLKRFRNLWGGTIALLVLVFLILLIFRERQTILSFDWSVNWFLIALSMLFHASSIFLNFFAWHWMISRFTGRWDFWFDMYGYLLSTVSNRIPTPLLYLGSRFMLYSDRQVPTRVIAISSTLEIILLGIAGGILSALSALFLQRFNNSLVLMVCLLIILFGFIFVLNPNISSKFVNLIMRKKDQVVDISIQRNDALVCLLIYLISWVCEGFAISLIFSGFVKELDFVRATYFSIISTYLGFLFQVLPTSLGIKEIMLGFFLGQWLPLSAGVIVAIVYRVLSTLLELVWMVLMNRMYYQRRLIIQRKY